MSINNKKSNYPIKYVNIKDKPKTATSSNSVNDKIDDKNYIKNNLSYFKDYLLKIKEDYLNKFKEEFEDNAIPNKTMYEAFQERMPYISRNKIINVNSIQIPNNNYFNKYLLKHILSLFKDKKPYSIIDIYGLIYFKGHEWIYFTVDEMFFQEYIYDSNSVVDLMYEDYINNKIDIESLLTENDNYIFPSSVDDYSFEKSPNKYCQFIQFKTDLNTAPDILIKLLSKEEEKEEKIDDDDKVTFDEYFSYFKYNFLKIDGALINDKKRDIIIDNFENIMIPYEELTVKRNNNKDEKGKYYICDLNKNKYLDSPSILTVPSNSVIFLQTNLEGRYYQFDSKNQDNFEKLELFWEQMEDRLPVILTKLILSGKYFFELYKELNLIKNYYSIILFLVFDNIPIDEISSLIKEYVDILINKNLINYQFTIRPLYMNSCIERNIFQIDSDDNN